MACENSYNSCCRVRFFSDDNAVLLCYSVLNDEVATVSSPSFHMNAAAPFPYVQLFPELKALVRERLPLFERTLIARTSCEEHERGRGLLVTKGVIALRRLCAKERRLFIDNGLFDLPFWPRFHPGLAHIFWFPSSDSWPFIRLDSGLGSTRHDSSGASVVLICITKERGRISFPLVGSAMHRLSVIMRGLMALPPVSEWTEEEVSRYSLFAANLTI